MRFLRDLLLVERRAGTWWWSRGCEDLWVTVQVKHDFKIVLCAVYLPPSVQNSIPFQFIDNDNSLVDRINECRTVVIGDFN